MSKKDVLKPLSARQAAGYCGVNFKTVLKWIDDKKLKAYQLPGSKVNRICVDDFLKFLNEYNMPVPEEFEYKQTPRILIVDDDAGVVNSLKRILRKRNYIIESALNGFDAGRKVEVFKPSLMLLDLKMPGINGKDVLLNIKSNESTKNIKVIVMSGYLEEFGKDNLYNSGADEIMAKPFMNEDLLANVVRLLKNRGNK